MVHPMKTGRFYYYPDFDLDEAIGKAALDYYMREGKHPDRAHVNPSVCQEETVKDVNGIKIIVAPDPEIVRHIVWMGEGNEKWHNSTG